MPRVQIVEEDDSESSPAFFAQLMKRSDSKKQQ